MSNRLWMAAVRATPHVLLIAILATAFAAFREWANVSTYRFYLDHRIDDARGSTATQRFDLDRDRVLPQLPLRDDRVAFDAGLPRRAIVRAIVTPDGGPATYELRAREHGVD